MRRALIGCTAVSLLGVASALVDYGLSHRLLWRTGSAGLPQEIARLEPVLRPAAERAFTAVAEAAGLRAQAQPTLASHLEAGAAPHEGVAAVSADIDPPHIITASMTPLPFPEAEANRAQDVNRQVKGDRLALPEVAVPKLVVPEPEPVSEGVSAALFMLSPSIPGPALAAAEAAPEANSAAMIAAGPVAAAARPSTMQLPTRNPFVVSATTVANTPTSAKISWNELVRMASMKGGDGEEPAKIFGALSEKEFRARELRCMATAIYFEARGESVRGQIAVGQVIMTRVRSDFYPNTICGVVFQGQWNRNACQFSFACDGHTDAPKETEQWKTALDVAKQVISGKVYLNDIADATHYHAVYVRPDWRRDVRRIKQLGVHIFYKAPFVKPLASDPDYQAL